MSDPLSDLPRRWAIGCPRALSGNIGSDWGSRSIARPYRASARNSTYVLLHSPAVCGTGAGAGFAPPFLTVAFFPGACFGARCLGPDAWGSVSLGSEEHTS